jgi:tRNA A-37 threonylcarbamoyl transferase component Bud32/tetratricopeptide (TPR) repeat protein
VTSQIREQLQSTLGNAYTLERELGGGGMSRVFVAEETALRRKVVVKLLSPELAQGISVERFEREIQTAAALQQANIVPVLSSGESNGLPYYTMPFVEGESLRARLTRGPLAITEVIGVLRDVAKALAYAHQRGVVHRDIKPDNVLLSGGTAVVTDFGIAKAISASRTASGAGATLTQIGTSIGTPAYMAPEQAAGDPDIDHRADIYSLGAMGYELLSGQVVFPNRTPQRMLAAHMSEMPQPVATLRLDTPAPLADLITRCLAKDPGQRPHDASDIARVLDTITSGSGMQSMAPILLGGPGMFRKALAIYAAAFVVVAVVAKAAIVGIGLPDWVFPGSLVLMALGLPVVLWTGYVQRVVRRAATATPTLTPGGTPSLTHGTVATIALRVAPHVSWYRTARGGMYALAAFVAMIGAFMGMRALGIGPFASLIASGELAANNKVVIADFSASNGDSALGRVVSEAVRAGLADSRVFTILSPTDVAAALQRMEQDPRVFVTLDRARQVAIREGAKAVVDGNVTPVGTSYIVSARLVSADSARELVSYRASASSADAIITVADELSRKLRAKAGESLRQVQASEPLVYATTPSLEALRKYSEGSRANEVDRDFGLAVTRLREAVQIDSNFAEGWRKLAVAMSNRGGFTVSASDSVLDRALALSGRLNERDRDRIQGFYHTNSTHGNRAKAIEAYERMLARGDSAVAINNLALAYESRREFGRSDTLFRAAVARTPGSALYAFNLIGDLVLGGKLAAAESALTAAKTRFLGNSSFVLLDIDMDREIGRTDRARARFDSLRKAGDRRTPTIAINRLVPLDYSLGRIAEAHTLSLQAAGMDSTAGRMSPAAFRISRDVIERSFAGLPAGDALLALDDAIAKMRLDAAPVSDRPLPYSLFAVAYAAGGRVDKAKTILGRFESEVRDTAVRRAWHSRYEGALASIATKEHRWNDAVELFRKSDREPDGPATADPGGVSMYLIWVWATAGTADSAIAEYERYLKTPYGGRTREGPDINVPAPVTEALAKIYDAKGKTDRAVPLYRDFIELWKGADSELQPRVAAARARLQELTPVEGRKR